MNRRSLLWLSAAGLTAAGTGLWSLRDRGLPVDLVGAAEAQDAKDVDTSGIPEMTLGSPDAKVEVIEYASFTCPHCAHWHATVWPELKKNYIDTGKIRFTLREVYFDRFGLWAAMVARCGGEMKYFGIVDMVFDTQKDWAQGDPSQIADNLRKIGRTAGITDDQMNACLNDGDMAQKLVALYQKNATADEITGTPSFIIDGKKYSNMDYGDFAKAVDEALTAKG